MVDIALIVLSVMALCGSITIKHFAIGVLIADGIRIIIDMLNAIVKQL